MNELKQVYVSLIADVLHAGHIKVLKEAAKLGEVTVGLLSEKAAGQLNDVPYLNYEHRKVVVENLSLVSKVIPQNTASYRENLLRFKPDYVIHGDDWQNNYQKKYRTEVIELLKEWAGELVEIPYSREVSEARVKEEMTKLGITTTARQGRLRKLLEAKPIIRILEIHNALSGLIVENIKVERNGEKLEFDGMWSSSLTDSISKGKPDIEAVDTSARINTINEIFEVTTKPMIYDADTGGKPEHFEFTVRTLERTGVSAVIVEDKTGLEKNSLFGNDVHQEQDSIKNFCHKIKSGKIAQITSEFMIVARIESLILEKGMDDALTRAFAYVDAGADGIMIHSRSKSPDEVIEFVKKFRKLDNHTTVVVVPTSYSSVHINQLGDIGVNIVIYANHMLRAAYPGMLKVSQAILENGRSLEAEKHCLPVQEVLKLIPGMV